VTNYDEMMVRVQLETIITEREGMVAENLSRVHGGLSIAYPESAFQPLLAELNRLQTRIAESG
jgi:hypothetical protein